MFTFLILIIFLQYISRVGHDPQKLPGTGVQVGKYCLVFCCIFQQFCFAGVSLQETEYILQVCLEKRKDSVRKYLRGGSGFFHGTVPRSADLPGGADPQSTFWKQDLFLPEKPPFCRRSPDIPWTSLPVFYEWKISIKV